LTIVGLIVVGLTVADLVVAPNMLYIYNMSRAGKRGGGQGAGGQGARRRISAVHADRDDLVFKALADSRRREMLDLLKKAPRTTGELCEHFDASLDRCTVMQHIGVLERADLIIARRKGRIRWNYLNAAPFREIYDRWISSYAHDAVALLARMKRDMEAR
jgi:DNA-binding transcriptional ArsR family regulator